MIRPIQRSWEYELLATVMKQRVLHVLTAPAKEAQPPTPVRKAKRHSHGIGYEPEPLSYALVMSEARPLG